MKVNMNDNSLLNNVSSRPAWRDLIPLWCYKTFGGVRFLGSARNDNSKLSSFISQLSPQRGQAMVTLLFFSVIAMVITTGAVMVMFSNSLNATRFQQGSVAYEVAQSGAENAILRLLRDPAYAGESLVVGNGTATITVTHNGGESYTILSVGTVGNFVRKIQVDGTYSNHLFTESSRREIY